MESLAISERKKYQQIWKVPAYSNFSPGEHLLPLFNRMVKLKKGGSLIDIGCGTGRAGKHLSELGWDVTLADFVDARERGVKDLPFLKFNIWRKWPSEVCWDQGYCCDVMEHLPPEHLDQTLVNIFSNCYRVFFSIHFGPDNFGKAIGHPLHLTIQPFEWWVEKLSEYGRVNNARDLLGMGVFDVKG